VGSGSVVVAAAPACSENSVAAPNKLKIAARNWFCLLVFMITPSMVENRFIGRRGMVPWRG
jgi:hypothetical protein